MILGRNENVQAAVKFFQPDYASSQVIDCRMGIKSSGLTKLFRDRFCSKCESGLHGLGAPLASVLLNI